MIRGLDTSFHSIALAVAEHAPVLAMITVGSVFAYFATLHYIPRVSKKLFERNIYGIDINKTTPEQRQTFAVKRRLGQTSEKEFQRQAVPESLGIVAGAVYLSVVMVLMVCCGHFRHEVGEMYTSLPGPLMTITVMLLLGFVDDVLDVKWRHKIVLTTLGSLPLIMTYDGSLSVLMPQLFSGCVLPMMNATKGLLLYLANLSNESIAFNDARPAIWLQSIAHQPIFSVTEGGSILMYVGPIYLIYLSMLCIFCTNSINILAGVNGVEVGQSIVIAIASVMYNLFQLRLAAQATVLTGTSAEVATAARDMTSDHQIRALLLLGPFIGVSLALWCYNRYPARIFVGDSYTYFAGTVLAVSGITGVYSKTLLLFFAPQVFNFIISLPQLFGLVVCPRHRVPTWNPKTDLLSNSHNYTILNVMLYYFGDMHEARLTWAVLKCQVAACAIGFLIRYLLSSFLYDEVH
ncbi:putative UDP-N-acetylglucosamine-dolichyl-phosphate N-acetylglucosaminephosphotransferase [Leptomonas seymouri]|uniref:UDP-N-acetylglucosamine--dolichyl-phosphate N-acetylglucosaminephosphotransferase n=1 Tax=Leptomonas seymouri TaxID=5684 RepID=A0A0N1HUV1_LEPSE|nr:putative UDP-N-acetylglucosamine-dolichyl-phosphate N-acetylglucosaminephosphotransferase [Leptomonas seymouri]|eukprot:KPI84145.1 putative UDP-N-acetylglucosamine-dolichyl-phosphate N-acetylglucosaminephosphotransferase [Leptomonas seymouri]